MNSCPLSLIGFAAIAVLASHQLGTVRCRAADQPQWGAAWTRNLVSQEKGLPHSFDPVTGKNIKWVAKLGTETHSTPVVANGRIYIGTNNGEPRDPTHQGDRGVLMCFDEKDGRLLWQLVVPKREEDPYFDWPKSGISSPATVEGDHVYIVSNRGEVLCLDVHGLANGNDGPFKDEGAHMTPLAGSGEPPKPVAGAEINPKTWDPATVAGPLSPGPRDADIIWRFDLASGAGIWPHDGAHSSILIDGAYLYLNTGTGVDNTHKRIRAPDAPGLVALDKRTGQLVARDYERTAPNIFHCTWSAPSMADVNGKRLVFFAGGDGIVYAFEALEQPKSANDSQHSPGSQGTGQPRKLKKVWEFDFDPEAPKHDVHRYNQNRREGPSNFYGMPVFWQDRLFVAGGGDNFWGKNLAWLKCIDATKAGNTTRTAEVWSYRLERHVMGTPAIYEGMVFLADCGRLLHCADAATGKPHWTYEIEGEAWASPLVADGKVYLGMRSGQFYVFEATKEKHLLSATDFKSPISATAVAANAVLYIATMRELFAIADRN